MIKKSSQNQGGYPTLSSLRNILATNNLPKNSGARSHTFNYSEHAAKQYLLFIHLRYFVNPVFVYGRVESRTVLPTIVINKFKPKYAMQRFLGLH